MQLDQMSGAELITAMYKSADDERQNIVRFISYLTEAERRKVYVPEGSATLFNWLTRTFKMSESSASRRITTVNIITKFPNHSEKILDLLATGKTHLQSLRAVANHLTEENIDLFLNEIQGRSRAEIEAIINRNVPERIKKEKREYAQPVVLSDLLAPIEDISTKEPAGSLWESPKNENSQNNSLKEDELDLTPKVKLGLEIRVTLDTESAAALNRLRDLYPTATLKEIIGLAVRSLCKKRDQQAKPPVTLHKQESPKTETTDKQKTHVREPIPVKVRTFIHQRDEGRCTFENDRGERCVETGNLEIDHRIPVAQGGTNEPENLRLLCRAHNNLEAERAFGREFMASKRENKKGPTEKPGPNPKP